MGKQKQVLSGRFMIILAMVLCAVYLDAQEPTTMVPVPEDATPTELNYRFDHLTPADGLPHLSTFDIIQDSQGFLWIASEGGLARYDGHSFKTFNHDQADPSSPSSDIVFELLESSYQDTVFLWFRTLDGLNRLNLLSERTVHFHHDREDTNALAGYSTSLAPGDSHSIWIGTNRGLDRYHYPSGVFQHFLPGVSMEAIHRDAAGHVWVGTNTLGLLKLDPSSGEVVQYAHDPNDVATISGDNLVQTIFDSDLLGPDFLWIGTDDAGFDLLDKQTGIFQRFPALPNNPGGNVETCFESTRFGVPELWSQTSHDGLCVLDLRTGRASYQQYRPDFPDGLGSDYILEMYEDHSGVIWVATGVGLDRLNRFEQVFQHFSAMGPEDQRLASGGILSIYLDSHERIWLGGWAGISMLHPTSGKVERFSEDPICPNSLKSDFVLGIKEDERGAIWFLARTGLYRLDPEWHAVTHYPTNSHDTTGFGIGIPLQAAEDANGHLWFACSGGVLQYQPDVDRFKKLPYSNNFNSILIPKLTDKNFVLLSYRFRGILVLDRMTGKTFDITANEANPRSLSSGRITHMVEGRDSLLWVGSTSGLDVASIAGGIHADLSFRHYGVEDGLPNRSVQAIQEDQWGQLWVSTENGLAVLDRETDRFQAYGEGDGIANGAFNFKACSIDSSGYLYFGSAYELVCFHPDSLKENPVRPLIALTDLQVFHEPVPISPGTKRSRRSVFTLPRSISYLDTLEMSYRENVFTLEFAALDFRNPHKNQYAYMLEGFDKDWIHATAADREVTYMNLDPGEYVFRVKGSNNDGLWNESGRSLTIIIRPPWWQSRWAYTGYILLGLLILTGVWWFQLNRIRFRHQLEMDHLRAERYAELDELKSRFFANISHEFRTPLTLILGPIEKWRQRINDKELKQDLSLMQKHAKRVLDLVTQLLDLSKLEAGKMQLQAAERNVVPLLKGLVLSFASLAERRKITLSFHSDLEEIRAYIDKEALVKIMNNLLSNAFKFTPDGGEINAETRIQEVSDLGPEGALVIQIVDSGIGIQGDRLESIFDRFTQVHASDSRIQTGAGIGLALTKELVEMHQGRISVESHAGEGSLFRVLLPLGRTHLDADEIVDSEDDDEDLSFEAVLVELDADAVELPGAGRAKPLILIVEDNTDVRSYLRSYLDRDYRCLEAVDGQDGLDLAINQPPDLIISDIMMPEMDGMELCQRIKGDERTSHIPVVLLTAKAELDSKLEGLEMGADAYLTKPFEADELLTRVRNLIVQRQKLREHFQKELHIIPADMALSSMDTQLVEKVLKAVLDRIDDPDFKVADLARAVHMSAQHLNRKLHALSGLTTQDFIRSIRLKQAALQLRSASGTVTEIAYRVGFRSSSHFARAFHMEYGQSPSEYLKQYTR